MQKIRLFIFFFIALNFVSGALAQSSFTARATGSKVEPAINTNPLSVTAIEIQKSSQSEETKTVSSDTPQDDHLTLQPGSTVEVKLKLQLEPGYHAYLEQYKFELLSPNNLHLSEFQIRPTVKFTDPVTKKTKLGTEGYAEMLSLLEIPPEFASGSHTLKFELTYQACGKDFCLFPQKIPLETSVSVGHGQKQDMLTRALEKGWVYALFLVFIAGLLTSFTPCIFPMIPITLAILGVKGHERTRPQAFIISLSYVLGIALTYSILGVAAAMTGALFGSLLGHPLVISAVAGLFVLMGLSMYGLFEIQIPSGIANRLTRNPSQKGMIGAFLAGLVAGIVASPCVGPVLISVLAYVAQTQNAVAGFVLLFTFALGLGQLFLVIGTFNHLLSRLPKSGPWMEQVKFIFGSIMIGMAFYYIYPVAHGPLFDGLVATALIVLSIYFGAFKPKAQMHTKGQRTRKAFLMALFVLGSLFAVKSLTPKHMQERLFVISGGASGPVEGQKVASPRWFTYSDELLEKAIQEGRPVIIDFKADWCLACKELELYTFSDPNVLNLGEQFIWLSFDATSSSEKLTELQRRYDIGGLPYVVFYNIRGEQVKNLTLTGFEKSDRFLERMKAALQ